MKFRATFPLFLFLCAAFFLFADAVAYAQSAAGTVTTDVNIETQFVKGILGIVVTVLGILAIPFANKLVKKFHLDNVVVSTDQLDAVIQQGLDYAQHKANNLADTGLKNFDNATRLSTALEFVKDKILQSGLEQKTDAYLTKLIQSKLGASGLVATTVPTPAPVLGSSVKSILLLMAFGAALVLSACATAGQIAFACGPQVITVANYAAIKQDIQTDGWEKALELDIPKYGGPILECVLQQLASTPSTVEGQRAHSFLTSHQAQLHAPPSS
jgi:hypothetical protein